MLVGERQKSLARLYLDGKTTYSRTSSSALSAEGVSVVTHAAEQCGVGAIFDPSRLPMVEDNEQAHEVQRPTMEGVHRAIEIMRVDPAILSEEDFCLAEITRQLIACGANVQVETPVLDDYPAWARALDWRRPADASAAFLLPRTDMQAGYYPYPVELIALDQMLKYGLGRPSTLIGHAEKFAGRNLYTPETGLGEKGIQWVGMTPDIFLWPETSVAIEAVLDQGADMISDRECIDRALELLREEQDEIRKHLRFRALADAFETPAPAGPSGQSVPNHQTDNNSPSVSAKHRPAGVSL